MRVMFELFPFVEEIFSLVSFTVEEGEASCFDL
jgi:hypothetical protein